MSKHTGTALPCVRVSVFAGPAAPGVPVAVVPDADGLSAEIMQRLASQMPTGETAFLLAPTRSEADYRLRTFTPQTERPFSSHATLAACSAWLQSTQRRSATPEVVQECNAGLIKVRQSRELLAYAAVATQRRAPSAEELPQALAALGLTQAQTLAAQVMVGRTPWLGLWVDSAKALSTLAPDFQALKGLNLPVVVAAKDDTSTAIDADFDTNSKADTNADAESSGWTPLLIKRSSREARAFASTTRPHPYAQTAQGLTVRVFGGDTALVDAPCTDDLQGSLAQWLMADALMPSRYIARQGAGLDSECRYFLERDPQAHHGQVWVGGLCLSEGVNRLSW